MHGRAERSPAVTEGARVAVDRERLQNLGVKLTRLPDVRQDRVDAIQRALQEGTYRVSAQELAEKVFVDFFGEGGPGEEAPAAGVMDDLTAPRIEWPTDSGSLRRYPTPRPPKVKPQRSAPPLPEDSEKPAESDDHQLDVTV